MFDCQAGRYRGGCREAERKMGQMLRETERAKANQYTRKSAESHAATEQPTLASLGLTKRESAEAQMLAQRKSRSR